jgi:hypothetical protein
LRSSIAPEHTGGVDATVLGMSAQVAIELGRTQDAIRFARRAIENATVYPVDRARSRGDLARGVALAGDRAAAVSEGQRALAEADRMGILVSEALACAVLVDIGEGGDIEAIWTRGRSAFESYLDAAPEDRRAALEARRDLQFITRTLKPQKVKSHAR